MTSNNKKPAFRAVSVHKRAGADIFAGIASRLKSVKQSKRWSFPHVSIQ